MREDLKEKLIGFNEIAGFYISDWNEGSSELTLDVEAKHMNRTGSVHGGLYASIVDAAMGMSCCYTGDPLNRKFVITLSMTVNYIGTVKAGRIRAYGKYTGGGKSICFAEGKVIDDAGNVLITASATFKRVNYSPSA